MTKIYQKFIRALPNIMTLLSVFRLLLVLWFISPLFTKIFSSASSTIDIQHISLNHANLILVGETHVYNKYERRIADSLVQLADVGVHEGIAFGSVDSSFHFSVLRFSIRSIYSILSPALSITGRQGNGLIDSYHNHNLVIEGLEVYDKKILFFPYLLLIFSVFFVIDNILLFSSRLRDYIKKYNNTYILVSFIVFVLYLLSFKLEVVMMRNKLMADRIISLSQQYPNKTIIVGMGSLHLPGVSSKLIEYQTNKNYEGK